MTSVEHMGLRGLTIHQNKTEQWNEAQWKSVLQLEFIFAVETSSISQPC